MPQCLIPYTAAIVSICVNLCLLQKDAWTLDLKIQKVYVVGLDTLMVYTSNS